MNKRVTHNSRTNYRKIAEEFAGGQVYVAFDTETSGLSCRTESIIEIAAVKFDCNGIIEKFSSFINPGKPLSYFITNLTGITDEMLCDADDEACVIKKFLSFTGKDTVLIAHNAPFDIHFVNAALERMKLPPLKNRYVDTLPFTRNQFPEIRTQEEGAYRLENLAKRFKLKCGNNHRALADSVMCMKLFELLVKNQEEKSNTSHKLLKSILSEL